MSRKEVFFVIGSLSLGGAEKHLVTVGRDLVRRGYTVTIYCLLELGPLEQTARECGIHVIAPPIIFRPRYFRKPIRATLIALSFAKLFMLFAIQRPCIAHFFLPIAYILGAIASRLAFLPIKVMSRRSLNNYQEKHKILAQIEWTQHGAMTAILGNSNRVITDLESEGADPNRLGLIHNGIDLAAFDVLSNDSRISTRRALGLTNDELCVCIVANLIPYKGHSDLLKALGGVKNQMPDEWSLLVVGRDDGIGSALQKQAFSLGIGRHVHFLGPKQNTSELLDASDIGVLCSHEEGFSNALLEGMAASLPMVVTDVGGNAEAVVHGETGFVVPAERPEELGIAILRLAHDKPLAQKMGVSGRLRVEAKFSLASCVDKYETLYSGLLDGTPVVDIPLLRPETH